MISFKIPFTSWWAGGQGLQYGTGVISVAGVQLLALDVPVVALLVCTPAFVKLHESACCVTHSPDPVGAAPYLCGCAAGISFTFLTTAQNSIKYMLADGDDFDTAYGRFIGTLLPCTWCVPFSAICRLVLSLVQQHPCWAEASLVQAGGGHLLHACQDDQACVPSLCAR